MKTPTWNGRAGALLVLACASGAFGVNYEVLLYRMITTRLGDLLHVHAAILGTFLAGMAVGAALSRRMRVGLWQVEVLTGIYALVLVRSLDRLDASGWLDAVGASPTRTMALCAALALVPALLVGMSVPLYTGALRRHGARDAFGRAYLLYNLGAAASVLVAEYVLVRTMGYRNSLAFLGTGNLLLAVPLYVLFRPLASSGEGERESVPERVTSSVPAAGLLLLGAASAIYQMHLARLALELLGGRREVFALATALSLAALPLALKLPRRGSLARAIQTGLAAAFLVLALFPWIRDLASPAAPLERLAWLAVCGLVTTVAFGTLLPRALPEDAGPDAVGRAAAWNSAGNALGYLVAVTLVLRLPEPLQLVVVALLSQAGILAAVGWQPWRRADASAVFAAVSAALVFATWTPAAHFRHHLRYFPGNETVRVQVRREMGGQAGFAESSTHRSLFYMGHTSVVSRQAGKINPSETLSGVLPAIFAPRLDRACVLGVGTGITAGATARFFRETDAVEINSAVLSLLPGFADDSFGLRSNPRARLIHDDAWTFLGTPRGPYDVIVNSVSAPAFEAAGKVFTEEFARRAKSQLAPDGVYLTWLGGAVDPAVESIAAGLRATFLHCYATWVDSRVVMLACADRPLVPRSLRELDLPPEVRTALDFPPGVDPAEYLTSLHLHDDFLSTVRLAAPHRLDHPRAEFLSAEGGAASLVPSWPSFHPEFVLRNAVTGAELSPEDASLRCLRYRPFALRDACNLILDPHPEGRRRRLAELAASPSSAENLRARLELLKREGTPEERLALHLALVEAEPGSAKDWAEASTLLEAAGRTSEAAAYRSRAMALSSAYRRFAEPPAGATEGGPAPP